MNYNAIKDFMEVDAYCSPVTEPALCNADWSEKRNAWLAAHRWQRGVVIRKGLADSHRNYLCWVTVSFNEALTREARQLYDRHGLYMGISPKIWVKGVDFFSFMCLDKGGEILDIRPAGEGLSADQGSSVSEKFLCEQWMTAFRASQDARIIFNACGDSEAVKEACGLMRQASDLLSEAQDRLREYFGSERSTQTWSPLDPMLLFEIIRTSGMAGAHSAARSAESASKAA